MIKCAFEWGNTTSLRHVTVDGIIIRGNTVLLGKRGTHDGKPILESGKWGFIGGFIDRDETIIEALKREAMEEAGCKIDNIRLFHVIDYPYRPKEDRQNITFVMVADFVSMIDNPNEEVKELKWFDFSDLPPKEEMAFDHGDSMYSFAQIFINGLDKWKIPQIFRS